MDYNKMMPVSLHEQVDEEAAALQFRTIMVRAQSAVQQDKDRSEAEKKFQQLSKGGQFQARDAQQKRKAGYGAAEQAAPVRQRVENDDGTWVYGATSSESFVHPELVSSPSCPKCVCHYAKAGSEIFQTAQSMLYVPSVSSPRG
jgi:hypothetical protein